MDLPDWITVCAGQKRLIAASIVVACSVPCTRAETQNGMILVPAITKTVGSSEQDRVELAKRFDCHPTWLNDDLAKHEVTLPAFWIDHYPVTNSQYLAFVKATKHPPPTWWRRWGAAFPDQYADHPVVGVSGTDAAAYAAWAGKRLPTAEQWEAVVGGPDGGIFAWGDAWPGPLKLQQSDHVFWEWPGTRPIGRGGCGRSAIGVEDFAGQVLEWVADTLPHHGVQFQLMKGASWCHEDPVSFRTASGWYAYEGWQSAFTGFRCALGGDEMPPRVLRSTSATSVTAEAARKQLETASDRSSPVLAAGGGTSRHISIVMPRFGMESIGLSAPETIIWNGTSVMTWRKTPDMTWTERTPNHAAYEMQFDELRVRAEFLAQGERVEQRFTAANLTDLPGTFHTSSCFNLQGHPMFYDCEQLRTYVMNANGIFVPMRRLSRPGRCVRWITGPGANELGEDLRWAVLAVMSRDGRRIIATGRAEEGNAFSVSTNTLFTCLHTDSTVEIPPREQKTTRQFFWFLEGALGELSTRVRRDLTLD